MKTLLFETNLNGHRIEYIHHIYIGMLERQNDDFVIILPEDFNNKKNNFHWPVADNILIQVFSQDELYAGVNKGLLRSAYFQAKLLQKYVNIVKPDKIFLSGGLTGFMPFLVFMIPSSIKVSGIIYKIYLYTWRTSSFFSRLKDVLLFKLFSGKNCIKSILVLNDNSAAIKLNQLYKTDKYKFISDPYNIINYKPNSIRKLLKVSETNEVFLHFGGLTRRKGTLNILKAINLLSLDRIHNTTFIFAGKVYADIKDEFYYLVKELKPKANIIVFDEFCSNELLADLCMSSDYLLMPYSDTAQSSGLLGHASYFGIPVIGPADGLIGKLIKKNHLGVVLEDVSPQAIAKSIETIKPYRLNSKYVEQLQIESFVDTVFESL